MWLWWATFLGLHKLKRNQSRSDNNTKLGLLLLPWDGRRVSFLSCFVNAEWSLFSQFSSTDSGWEWVPPSSQGPVGKAVWLVGRHWAKWPHDAFLLVSSFSVLSTPPAPTRAPRIFPSSSLCSGAQYFHISQHFHLAELSFGKHSDGWTVWRVTCTNKSLIEK